jgi:hypothetical protein
MLEAKCQTPLAKATAELMGVWAFAASQPAIQTLNFWTRVLRSSLVFPAVAIAQATAAHGEVPAALDAEKTQQSAQAETPAEAGFASYRSASGHAVAQIIAPEAS